MTAVPEGNAREVPRGDVRAAVRELMARPGSLPRLWGRRGAWQVKLRWVVAPLMLAGVLVARAIGFEFAAWPMLVIGGVTLVYNAVFAWIYGHYRERLRREPRLDRLMTILQVVADYVAMLFVLHGSGGAGSPLAVFLTFHVIIAAIQFSPGIAHLYAAWAAGGLWLLLLGEASGSVPSAEIVFRGEPFHLLDPAYTIVTLSFYTAALFITASMVSRIMGRLHGGVAAFSRASAELALANHKLNGLYEMVGVIAAERRVEPILSTATSELAKVLAIPAVTVKLLDEEGKILRYEATHGFPVRKDKVVRLDERPLDRRVVAGETLVHGHFEGSDAFELQAELHALGFRSAALAPLRVEDRVIGTLSIYAYEPDRFGRGDADFLELAAELVAIGIDDARANEEVERLMRERTEFMLEVAHNLRAPLGASLSMLELLGSSDLGSLNERQAEYASRIGLRLSSLHRLIGRLLTIGRARDWSREIPDVVVDLEQLAEQTRRTFEDEAAGRRLRFRIECDAGLPPVDSGAYLLEKVLENLVSNAIKYTPDGGEVDVRFTREGDDGVRIVVRDTGIGIPVAEQGRLFREFFRASNAKKHTRDGIGLGLVLVKQAVERHNGRLRLTSEEGQGTEVVIDLPARRPKKVGA